VYVRPSCFLLTTCRNFFFNGRPLSQTAKDANANKLALQMSRTGHHIRRTIVEEARAQVGEEVASTAPNSGEPEPIPATQEEYNAQADAALRDLFPRIPNTDRQMIVEHAFKLVRKSFSDYQGLTLTHHFIQGGTFQGQPVVGMVKTLPLSRRVQLAVLAHIRHNHTRYDQLLREVDYLTARKVVEQHCLDFLVKWRGDEETGRDQFDEILREVIVLSDDSDEESEDDESSDEDIVLINPAPDSRHGFAVSPRTGNSPPRHGYAGPSTELSHKHPVSPTAANASAQRTKPPRPKQTNRGFKRYEAVAKRWEEAVNRNRYRYAQDSGPVGHAIPMESMPSRGCRRLPSLEMISPGPRAETPRNSYMTLTPSHLHQGELNQGQPLRHDDCLPVANLEPQRLMPMPSYSGPQSAPQTGSQSVPSEARIIGRRITRVPVGPHLQSGAAPHRPYHEELKDYLVPSIEPVSPHSTPDVPQFVRQVIRGEPKSPEQVPPGHTLLFSHPPPAPSHRGGFRYDQSDSGSNGRLGPTMLLRVGEPIATQRDYYHGPQANLVGAAPEHARRTYRVREPIEENYRCFEDPVVSSNRVFRVHKEAPPVSWQADPGRVREFSPSRMDQYVRRSLPSVRYEDTEPRRIVHGEASASRFNGYDQGPVSSSAQLPHREAHRAQSSGFRQVNAFTGPDLFVPIHSTTTAVHQGPSARPSLHETYPAHQDVTDYYHRGRVIISYE
jgi:hypothetical protein